MQKVNFGEALSGTLRHDPRFDRDAYLFVREGLDFTIKMLKKETSGAGRHVTGKELLEGLRRHALDQFGPLTKTVLNHWNIHRCEDFADIVFNMVESGILGKSEADHRDDFKGGYDFDEAFVKPFRAAPRSSHRRSAAGHRPSRSAGAADSSRGTGAKKLSSGPN